jgi:outer membrane protein assembly factor BamB
VSTGVIDLGEIVLARVDSEPVARRRGAGRALDAAPADWFEPFAGPDVVADTRADDRPAPLPRSWAFLLSVVSLLMLTAGVRMPPPPVVVDRLSLGLGHYQVAGGRVFLMSGIGALTGVIAIDPADGRRLWQADLRERIDYANVALARGVAVVSPDPCTSGTVGSLVAIDAETGAERWRAAGVPVRTPPGTPYTVVVRASWSDRCGAIIGINRPLGGELVWEGRDPGTGEVRWQYVVPAGSRVALTSDASGTRWAAVVDADGHVTIVDFATGATAGSAGLVVPTFARIAGVGDLFLVSRLPALDESRQVTVTAYDRRTLTEAWGTRVRVADRPVVNAFDYYAAVPCGGSVCVVADQTTALAPDTGVTRWHTPRTMYTDSPAGMLADYSWGLSVGGLSGVFVHDPGTGRRSVRLADWRLLGVDPASGRILVGRTESDATVMAWLGATGGPKAIGAPHAHFERCEIFGDRLACESSIDELWIMRLRR